MRIKEVSAASGLPTDAIRHYEKAGLLVAPVRSHNGYRHYTAGDVDRLRFIRNCRALAMSLDEVRELLGWVDHPQPDCDAVDRVVARHLDHVSAQIADLRVLERQLRSLLGACARTAPPVRCAIVFALSSATTPGGAVRRRGVHGA